MNEPVDSLAHACAERDSARRWAKAWKRAAIGQRDGRQALRSACDSYEEPIARLTAERDAALARLSESEQRVGRLSVVAEAARAFDAILQRYESDTVDQVVEYRRYLVALEHLRAALAALDQEAKG